MGVWKKGEKVDKNLLFAALKGCIYFYVVLTDVLEAYSDQEVGSYKLDILDKDTPSYQLTKHSELGIKGFVTWNSANTKNLRIND
jgi:hypothetical protein